MGMKLRSYVVALATLAAAAAAAGAAPASAAAAVALPDLGMYQLLDFHIERTPDHHKLLRYTTIIVNVGAGNFQAEGSRASASDPEMSVVQRIFDTAGGSRVRPTPARMYWAGDGHNHWHLRDLETSTLDPLDDDDGGVRYSAKHGFCFFDNIKFNLLLPGAPLDAFYTGCGTDPNVLNQSMGLSIGWGDAYFYDIAYQWVDITGLRRGRYRLHAVADAQNYFRESDNSNNFTWTDLQIDGDAPPRVIRQGPFIPLPQV
jgi:hypothetical protein